ncbi:MAG: S41 family peptidase [Alphaproteobacteria bacterium]|jgi:carboxyl-terminal processing protease|nr:S41 family peptidase [Alphaproteobacteria bacterium]
MMTLRRTALLLAVIVLGLAPPAPAEDPTPPTPPTPEQPAEENAATYRALNLFGEVFERTRAAYVDEVEDKALIEHALNGMLSELDPHSGYMNAEDFKDLSTQATGEFGGLGIQVTMDNGLVQVVAPIDETPAARAGILPGDYIVEIDGKPVMGMSLDEAVDLMRGAVGAPIEIRVAREGAEPKVLTLTRETIPIHTVRHRIEEGNVGYIRISSFNQKTAGEVAEALSALSEETGERPLIGYVLDLRTNPGGVLDGAIGAADVFLERGEIVSTRGRDEDRATRENAGPGDLAGGLPMVVLINAGTASAAEIVAGALQDHGRAVVMGTTSFGKGSVQTLMPLGPGQGAMRLTTARYYTPSGRSIQATGIEPDITVEPARIAPLESDGWREADLKGALANPNGDVAKEAPEANEVKTPEEAAAEAAKQDYQLIRAVDLLRALAIARPAPEAETEAAL